MWYVHLKRVRASGPYAESTSTVARREGGGRVRIERVDGLRLGTLGGRFKRTQRRTYRSGFHLHRILTGRCTAVEGALLRGALDRLPSHQRSIAARVASCAKALRACAGRTEDFGLHWRRCRRFSSNARRDVKLSNAHQLARAFDVTVAELLRGVLPAATAAAVRYIHR